MNTQPITHNISLVGDGEDHAARQLSVSAPSEAWCILQGASPCRVRVSRPPVSSVAPVAEQATANKTGEAYTENHAGRRGGRRSLKCWYSFEMAIADAEGFNVRRRQHRSIRFGEDVEVRRSHQAAACMKRCTQELGRPIWLPSIIRYGDNEAQKGKPGNRTMRKPK